MAKKGLTGLTAFITKTITAFVDDITLAKAEQVAKDMLTIARSIVPVDTGKLKANIRTEITRIRGVLVGYRVTLFVDLGDVEYAIYVELGTRGKSGSVRMKAQPYITPATIMAYERNFT